MRWRFWGVDFAKILQNKLFKHYFLVKSFNSGSSLSLRLCYFFLRKRVAKILQISPLYIHTFIVECISYVFLLLDLDLHFHFHFQVQTVGILCFSIFSTVYRCGKHYYFHQIRTTIYSFDWNIYMLQLLTLKVKVKIIIWSWWLIWWWYGS